MYLVYTASGKKYSDALNFKLFVEHLRKILYEFFWNFSYIKRLFELPFFSKGATFFTRAYRGQTKNGNEIILTITLK